MAEAASTVHDRDGVIDQGGRKAIRAMAMIVGAVVLLELVGLAAWWSFSAWRLGRIELTNDGPPLKIQVLDESGDEPIGEADDLVAKSTLALPAGDYRLRVTGVGRLGRTYRFAVNRGETIAHRLSLYEGRLLGRDQDYSENMLTDPPREEPISFATVARAMELTPGKADLVEFIGETVIRRDGATGQPLWDTSRPRFSYDRGRDPAVWLRQIGRKYRTIHFVEPAPDLDGDGTGDVLLAVVESNALLALSGKDGSMLWNHVAENDGPGGPLTVGPDVPGPLRPGTRPGWITGQPAVGDVDGDGVPDLIATMLFEKYSEGTPLPTPVPPSRRLPMTSMGPPTPTRRVVQAISGRSGRWLWTYPIDAEFIAIRPWSPSSRLDDPAALVRGRRSSVVAVVDGEQWIGLDPATGRPRSVPAELGFVPQHPLRYADLDGDGEPEILAIGQRSESNQRTLTVFSLDTGQKRWSAVFRSPSSLYYGASPDWPWVIDVDGRSQVVLPDAGPMPPSGGYSGIQMLDGTSGRIRWVRRMSPISEFEDGTHRVLGAPDLDGDGVRDLVTVSLFMGRDLPPSRRAWRSEPRWIYVDALSGRDGHPQWSWHADLPESRVTLIGAPRWWGRAGWLAAAGRPGGGQGPRSLRRLFPPSSFHPPTVHVLEASTGREVNEALGLQQAGVADLDGDGLTDLWGEADGQLQAFRGEPPEAWRALGWFLPARGDDPDRPAADLDGDGIGDSLIGDLRPPGDEPTGSRTAVARSGRDGRLLWKTAHDSPPTWYARDHASSYILTALPLPAGDLDGDGTADVVVRRKLNDTTVGDRLGVAALPLRVLSGRSGRLLWSAGPLPLGSGAAGISQVIGVEASVIEPNAAPDLIVRFHSHLIQRHDVRMPSSPAIMHIQDRLARLSGRTGRILWDIPLAEPSSSPPPEEPAPLRFADVDGDGSLDAALMLGRGARHGPGPEAMVFSLRDGKSLGRRGLDANAGGLQDAESGTGRRTGGEEGTVFDIEMLTAGTGRELVLQALDGRDGMVRWTWRTGESRSPYGIQGAFDLFNFDGRGKDSICLSLIDPQGNPRVLILDPRGHERAVRVLSRDVLPPPGIIPWMRYLPVFIVDLDGDGRDELVTWYADALHAWGRDLKELWSLQVKDWPIASLLLAKDWKLERLLQLWPGPPRTLFVAPATSIDGTTGEVRWTYRSPPPWWGPHAIRLLDPGDATRMPMLVTPRESATICRRALPTSPRGDYLPPTGALVPPGLARDDPRWTRPLPWTGPILRSPGPSGLLVVTGLALVNLALPIGLLRLAARRRPWTIRLLMLLPVAAAVPLSALLAVGPVIPLPDDTRLSFTLGTLAGLPVLSWAALAGWSLVRLRWRRLAGLIGLTLLASAAIAAAWLWADSRAMPAIEHYGRSGWYLVVVPGAYAAGMLILIAWPMRRAYRWLKRPRRPATGRA